MSVRPATSRGTFGGRVGQAAGEDLRAVVSAAAKSLGTTAPARGQARGSRSARRRWRARTGQRLSCADGLDRRDYGLALSGHPAAAARFHDFAAQG